MPTVALAAEFFDAFAALPRAQQKKVREFSAKFLANPASAAIHYEKIHDVKDDKIRTVRVDQKYRAVVLHPEQGDVHMLVWVDNHDKAIAWAKNRVFEVNPATGAIQVVSLDHVPAPRRITTEEPEKPGLFSAYSDDVILSFGVPAVLLPSVRAVREVKDLVSLGKHLPAEADEALLWLAEGIPIEEVRDAVATYLRIPRSGRGKTLSRPQRARVWQLFEHYREALKRQHRRDWLTVIRDARHLLESGKVRLSYRAVVIDEAQDFHPEEWRLIRALVPAGPNDIFLVGDAHQRIYGPKVVLSRCGISIQGRSSRLRINYRTTEQIRAWAMPILQGVEADDLDGQRYDERGYRSLLSGPEPEARHFSNRNEERDFLATTIRSLVKERKPEEICLVARTNSLIRDEYGPLLKNLGIPHQILDRGREKPDSGIRLATMHRVKGLEFPVMLLAGINAKTMPLRVASLADDPAALADHEDRERSLLFVAATRARDRLFVTAHGNTSPFLENRDSSCT